MADRRAFLRRDASLAIVLAAGLMAACGGGGSSSTPSGPASAASSSPSASAAGDGTRPEGKWTLVAWTVKRSDIKDVQLEARTILGSFQASCASGPCDLTLSPAGSNGTYREPESPAGPDATPATAPVALSWDGSRYTGSTKPRTVSCTTAQRTTVAKGYTFVTDFDLAFVAASGSSPARLTGTITHTSSGSKASRAKGCTDFVETEAVGGVATGALEPGTPLAGTYDASLSATSSTPKSLAPVGTILYLGPMATSGPAATPSLTGLTKAAAPLTGGADGWSGAGPAGTMDCSGAKGTATKGADGTEQFTGLHAVAVTEDGTPILTGGYRLRANPNAAGLDAQCSLNVWEGRILLIPEGAGR